MGFYKNIRGLISPLTDELPILKVNEKISSDIDLFLLLSSIFEEKDFYKNEVITNFALIGSHMEFSFNGIPVAVFNMASVLSVPSYNLCLAGQALLDLKESEMADWCASHEESPYILIYLELGDAAQFESSDCAFAQNAHETKDCRFVINHHDITK